MANGDDYGPSSREQQLQHTAKLLVYLENKIGISSEEWLLKEAQNIYSRNKRSEVELGSLLKAMDYVLKERIVYNAHDRTARDLADWWEDFQESEAERERKEIEKEETERDKASGLKKLSERERKALGL